MEHLAANFKHFTENVLRLRIDVLSYALLAAAALAILVFFQYPDKAGTTADDPTAAMDGTGARPAGESDSGSGGLFGAGGGSSERATMARVFSSLLQHNAIITSARVENADDDPSKPLFVFLKSRGDQAGVKQVVENALANLSMSFPKAGETEIHIFDSRFGRLDVGRAPRGQDDSRFGYIVAFEERIATRIRQMMRVLYPAALDVQVAVFADVKLLSHTTRSRDLDPDKRIVLESRIVERREKVSQDRTTLDVVNEVDGGGGAEGGPQRERSEVREESVFDIPENIEEITGNDFNVEQISVSVALLVDDLQNITPRQRDEFVEAIKATIGFNPARNDVVNFTVSEAAPTNPAAMATAPSGGEAMGLVWFDLIKVVLFLVIGLVGLLLARRMSRSEPVDDATAEGEITPPAAGEQARIAAPVDEDPETALQAQFADNKQRMIELLADWVADQPKERAVAT
ncbi:MAG: flagellar M-ring protein FliF C-terminal domain-containing protein [Geminicoccaceae bacterium]